MLGRLGGYLRALRYRILRRTGMLTHCPLRAWSTILHPLHNPPGGRPIRSNSRRRIYSAYSNQSQEWQASDSTRGPRDARGGFQGHGGEGDGCGEG